METALVPWAALLTNADTWIAQLWNPLQEVESTLSTMGDNEEGFMAESWHLQIYGFRSWFGITQHI